jgi:hypothetical protein
MKKLLLTSITTLFLATGAAADEGGPPLSRFRPWMGSHDIVLRPPTIKIIDFPKAA